MLRHMCISCLSVDHGGVRAHDGAGRGCVAVSRADAGRCQRVLGLALHAGQQAVAHLDDGSLGCLRRLVRASALLLGLGAPETAALLQLRGDLGVRALAGRRQRQGGQLRTNGLIRLNYLARSGLSRTCHTPRSVSRWHRRRATCGFHQAARVDA